MSFITRSFFVLLLGCISFSATAGVVKGKISGNDGLPLPFAIVFIDGTTNGATANAQGNYQFSLQPGRYKLMARFIGYQPASFEVTITGDEEVTHNFILSEEKLEMKEVVVRSKDEDPAYRIIRQAIKRRKFHLEQVKSFQSSIYLKGVFRSRVTPAKILGQEINKQDMGLDSSGKGILYLVEEQASYYSRGTKERTVVHSVRQSGDPNGFGFSQMPSVITFYDNNVKIIDDLNPRGFVSPIAENALTYYRYKLEGQIEENGLPVYKISVIPKRDFDPCFRGTIYIVHDDYAIHSLDLTLVAKANMQMLDTMRIEQLFLPLRKDEWVIKSQVIYPVLSVFGFGITGNFVTVYADQKVNEVVPDSVFQDKIVSIYDKNANKKDTAYWNEARPVKLENDELRDYSLKDSIRQRVEDPHYIDSVRKKENKIRLAEVLYSGITLNTKQYKQTFQLSPVLNIVNYNTVEGLNIAPKLTWTYLPDTGHAIRGRMALRYGFGNTHFNGIASLSYTHYDRNWPNRRWGVGVEAGNYVFQFNPENPIKPLINTYTTLVYGRNHMKIYERNQYALRFALNTGTGFEWQAKFAYQQRQPLENNEFYSLWSGKDNFRENTPIGYQTFTWEKHNALLATLSLSYQPGYTYTIYPDHKRSRSSDMPVFTATYQKGIKGVLDSKTDFDKWKLGVKDDISMNLIGVLNYNIVAGGFFNTNYVAIPDMMHLRGNQTLFDNTLLESFQLAPYYRYSNTSSLYGEVHLEYDLKGFLTNKIPLLKQAKWYLLCGGNAYYNKENTWYAEAFAGIENIGYKMFRPLRVDFVYGWDSYKLQTMGFRISLQTNGFLGIKLDDAVGEW